MTVKPGCLSIDHASCSPGVQSPLKECTGCEIECGLCAEEYGRRGRGSGDARQAMGTAARGRRMSPTRRVETRDSLAGRSIPGKEAKMHLEIINAAPLSHR